jgi:protein-S-isoprenylcysteine O-methyltransferase Ste14
MSENSPTSDARPQPPKPTALDAIPLAIRGVVYAIAFLVMILGVVPWAAYRVDANFPALHISMPWIVRTIGWMLFGMTLALYLAGSFHLMSRGRGAYVEFDPPKEFVATGMFRWCRNPIALCIVLMLLWLAIAWSSTGVFLLFAVAVPTAHAQVVLLEEPLLRKRFGQPYEDFLRKVPRWLPRPPPSGRDGAS